MQLQTFAPFLAAATLALAPLAAQADILAAWDDWGDTLGTKDADQAAAGFSATVSVGTVNTSFGSTDGSFGTTAGASTGLAGLLVREASGQSVVDVVLTNNTGAAYDIDEFHFDFAPRREDGESGGYNSFTLTYLSGGLGAANTQIDAQSDLPYIIISAQSAAESDFPDYDYDLASLLSDITLDDGESATFRFEFSDNFGGNGTNVSSVLDNVAFVGAIVPEPGTLTLAIAGMAVMLSRRRA